MQIEQLFHRLKNGDYSVLPKLIAAEEPLAFDYLMRMTGMVDPSTKSILDIEHVFAADDEKRFEDFNEFRVDIYQTLRRFNESNFAEDTSALSLSPEGHSLPERLGRLEPQLRELVILRYRSQLKLEDVASLCFLSEDQVRQKLDQAIEILGLRNNEHYLLTIPLFPLQRDSHSHHGSVAVSQIMGDIEKLNKWMRFKQLLSVIFILAALIGAAAWFFKDEWIEVLKKLP
jgi:hypothetical protein